MPLSFSDERNEKPHSLSLPPGKRAERRAATVSWSNADPKLRCWVEANRPALELFKQGADCFDGISRQPGEPYLEALF